MGAIAGIGAWYPDEVRHNHDYPADFLERAKRSRERTFNDIPASLDPALRVTEEFIQAEQSDPFLGVQERRLASLHVNAVDAEVLAARRALEDACASPSAIDCVISYSAVPDRPTPPSASAVAEALGIRGALCLGLDVACASALVQLSTACAMIAAGQASNVLLTQSHLMLRTFPLLHPASPGLGDASTALVVSREGRWPVLACHAVTHQDHYRSVTWVRELEAGLHDPEDLPWWRAGGAFRVGSLDVDGAKALQRDTVAYGARTLREVAQKAGIDLERIQLLASAEPRGWIPTGILRVLGLDESLAVSVYKTRAHLGASGCVANLEHAYRTGRAGRSGVIALYAQGAGFTRAAALLESRNTDVAAIAAAPASNRVVPNEEK